MFDYKWIDRMDITGEAPADRQKTHAVDADDGMPDERQGFGKIGGYPHLYRL